MGCGKVRDQFSSLFEKEMIPSEEETVRKHIASCPDCRRDYEQFEKTVLWLRSAEEIEVPEGFLSGVHQKMEERKRKGALGQKAGWGRFGASLKLPIQAAAMVTVAILVIYLAKIAPFEPQRSKDVAETKAPRSVEHQEDRARTERGGEKEEMVQKPSAVVPPPRDTREVPSTPLSEGKLDQVVTSEKAPSPRKEPEEEKKAQKLMAAKRPMPIEAKPSYEFTLKISDREKLLPQLHDLVKRSRGEIVTAEGNVLLASLPAASLEEFRKDLTELGSLEKKRETTPSAMLKGSEFEGAGKDKTRLDAEAERRITVRILLVQE